MPPFEIESKQLNGLGEVGKQMKSREAVLQSQSGFQVTVESPSSASTMTASVWVASCISAGVMGKKYTFLLQNLIYFRKWLFSGLLRKASSN